MPTYGSVAGVQTLVPEMGVLSASTNPTIAAVGVWLAEAYAKINRAIGNAGYGTPILPIAALYPELTGLENLYAGAYCLRARGIDTVSGDDETASEIWLKDFYGQLKDLAGSNLALVGASPLPSTVTPRRRRIRTIQTRKIDGYARGPVGETFEVHNGEYTGYTAPAE